MKFLLATKVNMTQIFGEDGRAFPVTVLQAGPNTVTDVRSTERDGYKAVQLGFGERKEKNISKAVLGHLKSVSTGKEGKSFAHIKEYRLEDKDEAPKVGDVLDLSLFAEGEEVTVSSTSKGKGFQGVVKRHGFKGGRRSHGQKHSEREPGSIGIGGVQKVMKGMRMGGRMGGDRVTVRNLKIVKLDPESGIIYVEGAVPGRRGTLVEVKSK